MAGRMKRVLPGILAFFLLMALTGCKSIIGDRMEIERLNFVRVIGVDKSIQNPGGVRLTMVSKKASPGGKDSKEDKGKPAEILSSEGRTLQEAVRNFRLISDRQIFLGHVDFILMGEAAAKENAVQYLDFLTRDHELRLNAKVIAVKGATAEDAITSGSRDEKFVGDKLNNLIENIGGLSESDEVELVELLRTFDNPLLSAHLPCITLAQKTNKGVKENEKSDIQIDGLAIFKGVCLTGYMDGKTARGLNWPRNNVESGLLVVKDTGGKDITLEVHNSTAKIVPAFNNGELSAAFDIKVSSNIGEIMGDEDIFNEKAFDYLKKQQEDAIRAEIESALTYARQNNVDIFGISSAAQRRFPVKWEDIKGKWGEIFPKLKVTVKIDSKIIRTYAVRQPARYRKGQ